LLPFARIAVAAVAAVTLLSACGGTNNGSGSGGAATASGTRGGEAAPLAAAPTSKSTTAGRHGAAKARGHHARQDGTKPQTATRRDPVTRSHKPQQATFPGERGASRHEGKPNPATTRQARTSGPLGIDPCTLVTRSEAQAVVGSVSRPQLGLQGPTCIYQARHVKQPITLSLQRLSLSQVARLASDIHRTSVSGRKAMCMNYGGLRLLVPLSSGSVLTVGAPCKIAEDLAATALRRVH
jgi:hypothetical protein